jgi:hypothetical protein
MHIEFSAFLDMVFPSPWPGSPRPAVQFIHTQAFYQPVVIPAAAGIQAFFKDILDSRVRGNDGSKAFRKA